MTPCQARSRISRRRFLYEPEEWLDKADGKDHIPLAAMTSVIGRSFDRVDFDPTVRYTKTYTIGIGAEGYKYLSIVKE